MAHGGDGTDTTAEPPKLREIALEELAKHSSNRSAWIALHGAVYDVSDFLAEHPGGRSILLSACGQESTTLFEQFHGPAVLQTWGAQLQIGVVVASGSAAASRGNNDNGDNDTAPATAGAAYQNSGVPDNFLAAMDSGALKGRTSRNLAATRKAPQHVFEVNNPGSGSSLNFTMQEGELLGLKNLLEMETACYSRLPLRLRQTVENGSEDDETTLSNRQAWARYQLVPRVLTCVGAVDTTATVLGHSLSLPVLAGPASFHDRMHPDGEVAVARAAHAMSTGAVIQGRAARPLPEVISAAEGAPCFFQLYTSMSPEGPYMDRAYVKTVLDHAASLGFQGVFLTVDTPNTGNREKTFGDPAWVQELASTAGGFPVDRSGITEIAGPMGPFCTTMDWDDIRYIASITDMPLVLKGISSAEDAAIAASMSPDIVAGIVVSNHGGRNLDGGIATADALRRCAAAVHATVGSRLEIYVDGGIRRGKDILRALALGADAVLIGRPVHWGLSLGGADGVEHALSILQQELAISMQLLGCKTLGQVSPAHVWRSDAASL